MNFSGWPRIDESWMSLFRRSNYLESRITLTRLKAPLLYAYDASTFFKRMKGVLGVPTLGPTDALILRPCSAIHTFRVKQTLDVAFLNESGVVLKVVTISPNRISLHWKSSIVIEMAAGTAKRIQLKVGQVFLPECGDWI